MPQSLLYPTSNELRAIESDLLPVLTNNDEIFQDFPIQNVQADILMWEAMDSIRGLQGVRGLNGDPSRVKANGAKRYLMEPGYYGEFADIDEIELTRRRPIGQQAGYADITDLVRQKQDQLMTREIQRIRMVIWTLLTAGVFSILDERGSIVHTDAYTMQTASAAVAWGTYATATPLADFRAIQLLSRGSSTVFDNGAKAYMNRKTFNKLVSNTNANDVAGRRVTGLLSPLNLDEINRVLLGEGLPQIKVNDEGYLDDAGTFQPFIPDDKVVIIGRRTNGASLGEYRMTRNANNPNMNPGSYIQVIDSMSTGNPVPRKISVHRGHNGGPVLYFPKGIVVLSV